MLFVALTAAHVQAAVISGALYAVNSGVGGHYLMTIDKATGVVSTIGNTGLVIDGLTISPGGIMYAVDNSNFRLITLDPTTGAVDLVLGSTGLSILESLASRPGDGALFAVDHRADTLVSLNPTTGAASVVGGLGVSVASGLAGLSFSNDGSTLYAMDHSSGFLYTIETTTGAATPVGSSGQNGEPLGLAVDRATDQLFMAGWQGGGRDTHLYTINSATAASTFIAATAALSKLRG